MLSSVCLAIDALGLPGSAPAELPPGAAWRRDAYSYARCAVFLGLCDAQNLLGGPNQRSGACLLIWSGGWPSVLCSASSTGTL